MSKKYPLLGTVTIILLIALWYFYPFSSKSPSSEVERHTIASQYSPIKPHSEKEIPLLKEQAPQHCKELWSQFEKQFTTMDISEAPDPFIENSGFAILIPKPTEFVNTAYYLINQAPDCRDHLIKSSGVKRKPSSLGHNCRLSRPDLEKFLKPVVNVPSAESNPLDEVFLSSTFEAQECVSEALSYWYLLCDYRTKGIPLEKISDRQLLICKTYSTLQNNTSDPKTVDHAIQILKRLAEIHPHDPTTQKNLVTLAYGAWLMSKDEDMKKKRWDIYTAALNKARTIVPIQAFQIPVAVAPLFKQNKLDEVIETTLGAQNPIYPALVDYYMARAHHQMGNTEYTETVLKKLASKPYDQEFAVLSKVALKRMKDNEKNLPVFAEPGVRFGYSLNQSIPCKTKADPCHMNISMGHYSLGVWYASPNTAYSHLPRDFQDVITEYNELKRAYLDTPSNTDF